QIAEWKRDFPFRYEWSDDVIKPQHVVQEISNATGGEAFIVTGVGQHQMWTAQYYKFKHPRMWCTSGGLGTMGYGLPTAMGVQAAHPGKLVINIDVHVDKDECVFPMVPAGGANTDMILEPPTREVRDKAAKSQTGF